MFDAEPEPVICCIRYTLDKTRLAQFERYAETWLVLTEKYGGRHLGFFRSVASPTGEMSFPGLGRNGPTDVALALFSFADLEAYERFRRDVRGDPLFETSDATLDDDGPVLGYERLFLRPLGSTAARQTKFHRCSDPKAPASGSDTA